MYNGLKIKLEEVVDQLHIGDGVVIEHLPSDIYPDRTIGYVRKISTLGIKLTKTRESRLFLERFFVDYLTSTLPYYSFENVRVVDPVNKE